MDAINRQQPQREALRMQANREELVERIAQALPDDGVIEPLAGIHLARLCTPLEKVHSVMEPSLCVIAQGSKVVFVGNTQYRYDPFNYLLASIELPRASQVLEASKDQPYLSFRLVLDPKLVSSILVETQQFINSGRSDERAIDISPLDETVLDAVVRLVRLLDSPAEALIMMPLITREIIYRLLMGDQGGRLRHLALGGYAPDIARAIQRLREDYDQPLSIEQLAHELGMSVSGFHHHFKAVTAMSPLQFQKQLRLQEARRLMLGEDLDAASAAFRVGYQDASHFNREYKSVFGVPPMRDVQQLREAANAFAV